MALDIRKLAVRTLSGIVYVGIIVGCILGGKVSVAVLAMLFGVLGILEFDKMFNALAPKTWFITLLDILGTISLCLGCWIFPLALWVGLFLIRMITELYLHSEKPHMSVSRSLMSQIYLGLPLGLMVAIGDMTANHNVLLLVFIFLWINDTGAFLVGSLMGRHKLFERISPKKTWEGFFGGVILTMVVSAILCYSCQQFFGLERDILIWECVALVTTVFGTWGDLFESMIKRSLKIKDSGNLIPGHGGILDRIDSLLFAMPAVFLFFVFILS